MEEVDGGGEEMIGCRGSSFITIGPELEPILIYMMFYDLTI